MKDSTHKTASNNAEITIALAGNPNAGKTTLFNALTGLRQKVANYPGVTVEKKEGVWKISNHTFRVIDLPGLYSLDAASLDEKIALDVLKGKTKDLPRPDLIVVVVDSTNLERNLYLAIQILEMGMPMVIALTMTDEAEKNNLKIDLESLSESLGVPVVATPKGHGIDELSKAILKALQSSPQIPAALINAQSENTKIFERYKFINDLVQRAVSTPDQKKQQRLTDKIDKVLTHRFWGLTILGIIILVLFHSIFYWAAVPMELLENIFGTFGEFVRSQMPEGMLADLMVDGVIAGVGAVLVFLPQILLLFFFISILEDTGYMARAAFLMDKIMSKFGLHGKAFLPLISSFACAIPGIMATRTIENPRDRLTTILIAPFMSCSARLPVYTLMIAAFFADQLIFGFLSLGAFLMLLMYLLGILVALLVASILKKTLLKAPPPPFIMELPPYRLPSFRNVLQNMFLRAWLFVKRAGTTILLISIILWALAYFPRYENKNMELSETEKASEQIKHSYAGRLGHLIEPVIQPLGFDWQIGIALISSFAAREVFVSTLSIIYNVGKDANEENPTLIEAIRSAKKEDGTPVWTPLTALTLMVFYALAIQCMSTVAVVRRETNSWKWTFLMIAYMTLLAYLAAFLTYQIGSFLLHFVRTA
ncbi:MAG: ferrous iron transport protein B [Pyrinomonadaceae bacterium]|nr:ferrous iron transport protein B [Pyrinomonadaceae bacterium]